MFITVKELTKIIDKQIEMIENNKIAPVEKDLIIETNEKLIIGLKNRLKELYRISSNRKLLDAYQEKIDNIKAF